MLELGLIVGKPGSVKEIIVSVLSNEFPLTAKELGNRTLKLFNKPVTYQAIHKSLLELKRDGIVRKNENGKYQLHFNWILELEKFAMLLKDAYSDELVQKQKNKKSHLARIRFYSSPNDFYKILTKLVLKEKQLRLASKTPALILSKESNLTSYRKIYFENLVKRIKNGDLNVKYLFSTELTKQKILKEKDADALKRFAEYEKYSNLQLRHAPVYSVIAMAIGSKDFMFGLASPFTMDLVGIIHLCSFDTRNVAQIYDRIFSNAIEPYEMIEEIKKEL